jgi:hypothetical protein
MGSGWNVDRSAWESGVRLDSIETKNVDLRPQAAPTGPQMRLDRDLVGWFIPHLDWFNRSI